MKTENAGFYAIATLAVVLLFFGLRSFDNQGNFTVGQNTGINAPAVLLEGADSSELWIERSPSGSFLTEIQVNGANVDMLVDTGASYVTIRQSDAYRAGINVEPEDFRHTFSTANGEVQAARAAASTIRIGPAQLAYVDVYVLPDDKLDIGLLGMNALNRFESMEMTSGGMRLSVRN